MVSIRFLRQTSPALGFGFLMTFSSSIGQTYFISLFAGDVRAELGLSHGALGSIYAISTIASALVLVSIGRLADRIDTVRLSALTMVGLTLSALLMAGANSMLWLGLALFGLRLGGQGMLSHIAMTAIARWFTRERGRALSIATLGFPTGEALLPIVVALLLGLFTWREIWLGTALSMIIVLIPAVLWLGAAASRRTLGQLSPDLPAEPCLDRVSWTRAQVLCDGRFYGLLPGILSPPFIITGVFFHQVNLVEIKGWTLAGFAACYPFYAGSATAVALGLGWLVDRYSVPRILPFYLLPLALGLALLSISDSMLVAALFMILMGATAGGATIILGALWAELYGTAHLGSIRALVIALLVLATAIAPSTMGSLIDVGISLDAQFRLMSAYAIACAIGFALLQPRLRRNRTPPALTSNTN